MLKSIWIFWNSLILCLIVEFTKNEFDLASTYMRVIFKFSILAMKYTLTLRNIIASHSSGARAVELQIQYQQLRQSFYIRTINCAEVLKYP